MIAYRVFGVISFILFLAFGSLVFADEFDNSVQQRWMLKRLMHPSERQLTLESQQKVFLYVGLKDKDIDKAMDKHFDRIESFMLVNVIRTDDSGTIMRDSVTGSVLTEEDGC